LLGKHQGARFSNLKFSPFGQTSQRTFALMRFVSFKGSNFCSEVSWGGRIDANFLIKEMFAN
jgi:hypothetical protein